MRPEGAKDAAPPCNFHKLVRFANYKYEKHTCGYCGTRAYWWCETCYPDRKPEYAICGSGSHGCDCHGQHCAGVAPSHECNLHIRKKREAVRASPRKRTAGARDPEGAQTDPTDARPTARTRLG